MSFVLLFIKNKVLLIFFSCYRLRLVCKIKFLIDKSSFMYFWKFVFLFYRGCLLIYYICVEEVKKFWIKFWVNFLFVNVIDEEER